MFTKGKKIFTFLLILFLALPLSVEAALSDDINNFKQKYAAIYQGIEPAVAAKMDVFIPEVLDYLIDNYDSEQNIDVQIKNAIASTLLTGDKYKDDLLPFLMEQANNKEAYHSQLEEMQSIVRKEAQHRLDSALPLPPPGGGGGGSLTNGNQSDLKTDPKKEERDAKTQTQGTGINQQSTFPATTPIASFQDIGQHWARADIEQMANLGLISGVTPGLFEPDRSITRAEFTAILLRTIGIKAQSHITGRFGDVLADQWYFDPVNTAADLGLINGYSSSAFAPQEPVTREQMAVMIDKALTFMGRNVVPTDNSPGDLVIFTDSQLISPWATAAIDSAVRQGLICGRDDHTYAPLDNASRAEASVLLLKIYRLQG